VNLAGMESKRADILVPGVLLTRIVLEKTGINQVKTSSFALREGMILDHIKTNRTQFSLLDEFPSVRERSVHLLLRKCNWHEKHSRQVARLALILFDELKPLHHFNEHDRELLEYACFLHDIGYHISHQAHHLHALYLIKHADLRGFDYHEICILAHTARYHRRSTPKKRHTEFQDLPKDIRKRIKGLSAFLRVADGLDRSHFQTVQAMNISVDETEIGIHITAKSDPAVEIWGALRKSELFEKLFDRKLSITYELLTDS
jgi:exopolyphosphatase/guanosine-5'-triphosphate,3'-diphosphate pyrophosphatase